MAYIGKKPEDKFRGLASYDTFTGDGSTTTFDVTNILPDGGTYDVEVFVDNVRQEGGSGKSYTIGNDGNGDLKRITFAVAPDNGAEIYVINPGRNTAVVTVTDNSLTAAKLQTDAVTTAKIQDDAVTTAKIQDDAVTSAKIADGTIASSNIAPGTIANDRLANSSITINGNAVSLGGSITAGTDWQAVTVADGSTTVNAVAGKGYFLDTNAGVIEVFLPTSPTRGDTIILMDYAGTFATNNVIVNTGTTNLDSTTTRQYRLTTNDTIAEFVYVDSAKGWVTRINTTTGTTPSGVFTDGIYDQDAAYINATGGTVATVDTDYKVHSFTGDGCFVVTAGQGPLAIVDYLVIAGGAGGGSADHGGGGGAGGYREAKTGNNGCYTASPLANPVGLQISPGTYPITVGSGGAGGTHNPTNGADGNRGAPGNNSIFSTITSGGGGGGGQQGSGIQPGLPGGSGGGGASGGACIPGGTGNTPPVSPPQGNPGGTGISNAPGYGAGGGGGAGAAGQNGTSTNGGNGGNGVTTSINGSPATRGGGGGGAALGPTGGVAGSGGSGGGANGSVGQGGNGNSNSGGGGGGSERQPSSPGGSGGSGLVIIRYKFQ